MFKFELINNSKKILHNEPVITKDFFLLATKVLVLI